jgi:hypothetical protein
LAFAEWMTIATSKRLQRARLTKFLSQRVRAAFHCWAVEAKTFRPSVKFSVSVKGAEFIGTHRYTVYVLEVSIDAGTDDEIEGVYRLRKRYHDFYSLHTDAIQILCEDHLSVLALQQTMPSQVLNKNSPWIVKERTDRFQLYLDQLCEIAVRTSALRPLLLQFLAYNQGVSGLKQRTPTAPLEQNSHAGSPMATTSNGTPPRARRPSAPIDDAGGDAADVSQTPARRLSTREDPAVLQHLSDSPIFRSPPPPPPCDVRPGVKLSSQRLFNGRITFTV